MSPPPALPGGAAAPMQAVSLRAIAIACALMPLMAMWIVQAELIWYSSHSTAISLFYHVTVVILALSLASLALARWKPSWALSPGEILVVYVMLSVGGTLVSHDFGQILVPMLAYPVQAATPQNRWEEILLPYIREWSIVQDLDAARYLGVGNWSMYDRSVLAAWAPPLLFWGVFILALMGALLALNTFFRQPWTEKERLAFPIIQIPLMISTGLPSLLRDRLFWIAFALAGGIDFWNNLAHINPSLPDIPVVKVFVFSEYLETPPWNAIGLTEINLYPFVIGLAFFLPLDLAFSCWFFFILFKVQQVVSAAIGMRELPGAPYHNEQAAGAYLSLGLLAAWLSRRHLVAVGRRVLGLPGGADESAEPLPYRASLALFVLCSAVLVGCGMALGASMGMMLLFFGLFFLYSLAIARMRAELGPPAHDLHNMGPDMLIANAVGTENLDRGNMAAFTQFFFFNRAYRAHVSAHSMEGFKIAQLQRLSSRSMLVAMGIAIVVGLLSAYWALLHGSYVHGYATSPAAPNFMREAWIRTEAWINNPTGPMAPNTVAAVIGLVVALGLGALRMGLAWWPLHPVGYATCSSWTMEKLWACVLIAWALKLVITRYGGAPAYRRAIPFFVGLVLGEFVVGAIWALWGIWHSTPVYHWWG